MRRLGVLAALLLAAGAPLAASAEMIRSAETGIVSLRAMGPPVDLDPERTIKPGEIAWREDMRPEPNVRLLDAVRPRPRPTASGVAAGAVLFGYALRGGHAFCPAIDYRSERRRVQCFRDFDGDGRFDGAYVTDRESLDSPVGTAFLHGLAASPKLRFEPVAIEQATPVDGAWIYKGQRRGSPTFLFRAHGRDVEDVHVCEPRPDGDCEVFGLRLRVTEAEGGVRVKLVSTNTDDRVLSIEIVGGPIR